MSNSGFSRKGFGFCEMWMWFVKDMNFSYG